MSSRSIPRLAVSFPPRCATSISLEANPLKPASGPNGILPGCHGDYDVAVEPYFNWQGSMMAQASRDILFEANMVIANQDAPIPAISACGVIFTGAGSEGVRSRRTAARCSYG